MSVSPKTVFRGECRGPVHGECDHHIDFRATEEKLEYDLHACVHIRCGACGRINRLEAVSGNEHATAAGVDG
jgi:hypothetical protein